MEIIETHMTIGASLAYNCKIWQTNINDTYISDYDIRSDESLKDKDLYIIFNRFGKYTYISKLIFDDKKELEMQLKSFNNQ